MSDVGDVARAVEVVGKIAYSSLHPSQADQIKDKYEESRNRCDQYKNALLNDDSDTQRRLEYGLLSGIVASFSAGEITKLESKPCVGFNKFNQLGWFQRAEEAKFAQSVNVIIRATIPSDH